MEGEVRLGKAVRLGLVGKGSAQLRAASFNQRRPTSIQSRPTEKALGRKKGDTGKPVPDAADLRGQSSGWG